MRFGRLHKSKEQHIGDTYTDISEYDENNPNSYVEYCIEYKELVDTKNIRCLAFQFIANKCIPAWSLHRLLMMYGDNYSFFSLDNAYGELIHAIAIDIEKGTFNKDYLEEKKS